MSRTEEMRRFSAIEKLENRLESTSRDEPRAGFERNWFGSHDRTDLRAELLAAYEALVADFPENPHFRYRHAGALARACRYDDAHRGYAALIDDMLSAQVMLAMVELASGDRNAAARSVALYNERCEREGMLFMQTTLEKISLAPQE